MLRFAHQFTFTDISKQKDCHSFRNVIHINSVCFLQSTTFKRFLGFGRDRGHSKAVVRVGRGFEPHSYPDGQLQFSHKLPLQTRFRSLPLFNFSAWESPFEWQAHLSAPLNSENATAPLNDAAGYVYHFPIF